MTEGNNDGMMLSRRDAIRGGAALGTMALASRIGAYAQVVEAQITEPRIQLGSDYAIHDSGGNLVINHDPNGDIIYYDATADQITTLKPLTSVTTGEIAFNGVQSGESSWFLEDEFEDTDTSTDFSYDSGVITVYDAYVVMGTLYGHNSGTPSAQDINTRVNGVSSANYEYNEVAAGSVVRVTGATSWAEDLNDTQMRHLGYLIRGRSERAVPGFNLPTMGNFGGGPSGNAYLLNGSLTTNEGEVNRISVDVAASSDGITGHLAILGIDY